MEEERMYHVPTILSDTSSLNAWIFSLYVGLISTSYWYVLVFDILINVWETLKRTISVYLKLNLDVEILKLKY